MLFSRDDKHIGQRYLAEKLVGKFETQYRSVPGARFGHRLALRMTKATESCINFHCDGAWLRLFHPTEYKGGSLCFYAKDKVIAIA